MKKGFTLIELLVAIVLSLIFLDFVFTFKLNFFNEIQTLKDQNELNKKMYNFTQIIQRGFKSETTIFPGLITLKNYEGEEKFKSNDGNKLEIKTTTINNLKYTTFKVDNTFTYKDFPTNDSLKINQVEDMNGSSNKGLFEIAYDAYGDDFSDTRILSYKKLVYVK